MISLAVYLSKPIFYMQRMLLNYKAAYLSLAPMFRLFGGKYWLALPLWLVQRIAWGSSHTAYHLGEKEILWLNDIIALLWSIWNERNSHVFKEKEKCFDSFL